MKHYLDQTKSDYLVFGRDENEFHEQNFVQLIQLEKIEIESLANKTINLDKTGANENLKQKSKTDSSLVHIIIYKILYLPHYAKDVLQIVRENCFRLFITINNPDKFLKPLQTHIQSKNSSGNNTVVS